MIWNWLLGHTKERHADELRDMTHDAINELQRVILDEQVQRRKDDKITLDILSDSEKKLSSIAEQMATATGAGRRGYNP